MIYSTMRSSIDSFVQPPVYPSGRPPIHHPHFHSSTPPTSYPPQLATNTDAHTPADSCRPGNSVTLLYDVARSPLPVRSAPVLKGGFNNWETVVELPMQAANFEFPQRGEWGTWFKVGIELPYDIFEFVYVVYDRNSNTYDNNGGIDF